MAGEISTLLFGGFFKQKIGAAQLAFFSDGLIPDGERAVRKEAASVKDFATPRLSLNKIPAAFFFRAFYACCLSPIV